ncbi:contact-dependent growth inhibition system immunity protein [Vogesella facilis]|uniref:Contact-dependent growth inhibition system immunity protein n=1 Tax=Vogesella facilis TaxID=1655232 RepID=A0ABV7RIF4_9NEIS
MQSTELLKEFFAGYFHQDYLLDDPTWEAVVLRYRADSGDVAARAIADEIQALVATSPSEKALESFLFNELGCYYTPRPDLGGPNFSLWLGSVSAELVR